MTSSAKSLASGQKFRDLTLEQLEEKWQIAKVRRTGHGNTESRT